MQLTALPFIYMRLMMALKRQTFCPYNLVTVSLYRIYCMVFIIETHCVLCDLEAES
jgi:hypothetical protein